MSALIFERVHQTFVNCENPGCNRSGRFRVMIAGWHSGVVCLTCRRGMQTGWDSALTTGYVDEQDVAA